MTWSPDKSSGNTVDESDGVAGGVPDAVDSEVSDCVDGLGDGVDAVDGEVGDSVDSVGNNVDSINSGVRDNIDCLRDTVDDLLTSGEDSVASISYNVEGGEKDFLKQSLMSTCLLHSGLNMFFISLVQTNLGVSINGLSLKMFN